MERSVAIHDGPFHADEVTACALLILFDQIDRTQIVRTRDPAELQRCAFVCDVGGIYDPERRLFDHHQAEYEGPLSSAGMVLQWLRGEKICDEELFHHLRDSLVAGVDAHDTGHPTPRGVCTFSLVVANFAPIPYDASDAEFDCAFEPALDFALGHIERLIARFEAGRVCREEVEKAMSANQTYLIFDHKVPWLENFFALGGEQHPAQFVIMPAGEHYKLRGIPPSLDRRMAVRIPHPQEWGGLLDKDLVEASGIEGAVFCHKGGFVSVWETREAALQALEEVMRRHDHTV